MEIHKQSIHIGQKNNPFLELAWRRCRPRNPLSPATTGINEDKAASLRGAQVGKKKETRGKDWSFAGDAKARRRRRRRWPKDDEVLYGVAPRRQRHVLVGPTGRRVKKNVHAQLPILIKIVLINLSVNPIGPLLND